MDNNIEISIADTLTVGIDQYLLDKAQKQQKLVFKSASMKVSNDRFVWTLCDKTGHNLLECGWLKENLLYSFLSSRQHLPFNWENIYTDGWELSSHQ